MHRKDLNERSPVRVLEASIHGGLGRGNIGVVIARHGVGKTPFLVGVALDDALGRRAGWNPFSRTWTALVPLLAIGYVCLRLAVVRMPQVEPLIPWRHLLAMAAGIAGLRVREGNKAQPQLTLRNPALSFPYLPCPTRLPFTCHTPLV